MANDKFKKMKALGKKAPGAPDPQPAIPVRKKVTKKRKPQ